jgi:tetratricopeptide (TPR) repeat protein
MTSSGVGTGRRAGRQAGLLAAAILAVAGAVSAEAMFAPAAMAQDAAPPDGPRITVNLGTEALTGEEADAQRVLARANDAFNQRGFAGLTGSLRGLRQAMDRAPETYPRLEARGEDWIVRAIDMDDAIPLAAAAADMARDQGKTTVNVYRHDNVYPGIALLLGSEAVERQRYDEAITWLDRGLKLQPGNWMLINEKLAAMMGQSRWSEVLALAETTLAGDDMLVAAHAARFHRRRGSSLIELGRLDEARAAFEASLTTEPDSVVAKNELEYIRGLQAGAAPTATVLSASGANGKSGQ